MVDIFQYSNMYTLKPSITRLAADETIITECGTYVTRRGFTPPPWPTLLGLYSRLLPAVTIHEWLEGNEVLNLGIDPRRFVSFGIIKGFLRRVHRWPVMLERGSPLIEQPEHSRRRVEFDKTARIGSGATLSTKPGTTGDSSTGLLTRHGESTFTLRSMGSNASLRVSPSQTPPHAKRPLGFTSLALSLGSAGESSRRTHGTLRSGTLRVREEQSRAMEEDLMKYLDGKHHSDEIQVRFGMGWAKLERVLGVEEIKDGRGRKGVAMVYR